jgi:secreted trypsin-like serine protease
MNFANMKLVHVRVGEHDTSSDIDCDKASEPFCNPPPENIDIDNYFVHEQYDKINQTNDIALIRLKEPITSVVVRPICLPMGNYTYLAENLTNVNVTVAGWGTMEASKNYPNLCLQHSIVIFFVIWHCSCNRKR